jgi:large subunit ribosomal protein L35
MPWRLACFATGAAGAFHIGLEQFARFASRCCMAREASTGRRLSKESEMPKLKTKSGAKKRFKMTATGKVKAQAQGKRHGMIKRTAKFIRNARGTMVLCDSDARIVKKYMPYDR